MRKIFEDTQIANVDRMTTSVGPGSTDNPFPQTNIPTQPSQIFAQDALPFEIQNIVTSIGNQYVSLVELKNKIESAKMNPAVKEHKKHSLDKILSKINKINKLLVSIPMLLDEFSE